MQITKKQHYIPQGLIKHFSCGDRNIFELNKNDKIYENSIRNTMCQNFVYEHDELPVNTIENLFAKKEGYFIPKHDELILEIEKLYTRKKEIPIIEIKKMIYFYVLLYLRSGALLEEYSAFSSNPEKQRVEKMLENFLEFNYPVKLTKTILEGYEISIIISEEENFIMSDQFIGTASLKFKNKFSNMSNRQIGFKDTIIFIPLTPKCYIVFCHGNKPDYIKPKQYSILNTKQVDEVNSIIANNSYNKTISSNREPLEKIKFEEAKTIASPMRSIMIYKDNTVSIFTIKKELEFYDSERKFSKQYLEIFGEYQEHYKGRVGRNDICLCGSKKKYKKCCLWTHDRCLDIVRKTQNKNVKSEWYAINSRFTVEKDIEIYRGLKKDIPDLKDRNIIEQISKQINT